VEFRSALRRIVKAKCASEQVPGDLMGRIRSSLWDEN
jgi:hypothetical protein